MGSSERMVVMSSERKSPRISSSTDLSIDSADSRWAVTAAANSAAAASVSGRPVAWRPLTISRGAPNFSATAAAQRAAPLDAVVPSTPTTTGAVTVGISGLTGTGRRSPERGRPGPPSNRRSPASSR